MVLLNLLPASLAPSNHNKQLSHRLSERPLTTPQVQVSVPLAKVQERAPPVEDCLVVVAALDPSSNKVSNRPNQHLVRSVRKPNRSNSRQVARSVVLQVLSVPPQNQRLARLEVNITFFSVCKLYEANRELGGSGGGLGTFGQQQQQPTQQQGSIFGSGGQTSTGFGAFGTYHTAIVSSHLVKL